MLIIGKSHFWIKLQGMSNILKVLITGVDHPNQLGKKMCAYLTEGTKAFFFLKGHCRDVPGGPVVKTLFSNARGASSIPGRGARIPHAS